MTNQYLERLSELSRAELVAAEPVPGAIIFRIIRDGRVTETRCESSTDAANAVILAERWQRLKQAERRLIVQEA